MKVSVTLLSNAVILMDLHLGEEGLATHNRWLFVDMDDSTTIVPPWTISLCCTISTIVPINVIVCSAELHTI